MPGRPGARRAGAGGAAPAARRGAPPRLRSSAPRRHSGDDSARAGRRAAAPGSRAADRCLRRLPPARVDRRVAHARGTRRDPARHALDARDRQSPEGVLPGQRGPPRGRRVPGEGLPVSRPGGDLRRPAAPAPRRRPPRARRSVERRRRRAADPGSRSGARDAGGGGIGAPGPERTNGKGRPADGRQGPAPGRFRVGHPAAGGAAFDLLPHRRRNSDGLRPRRIGERRRVVHRRGRDLARRMARGDQPLRRPPAAGDLLRSEQPDRPLDARFRPVGGARLRGEGRGLRHPRHHARRHRARSDRGGLRLGRRAGARRARTGADRALLPAHLRPCAPRRHALPRKGTADLLELSTAVRGRVRRPGALRVLVAARSHPGLRRAARGRGRHRQGGSRALSE